MKDVEKQWIWLEEELLPILGRWGKGGNFVKIIFFVLVNFETEEEASAFVLAKVESFLCNEDPEGEGAEKEGGKKKDSTILQYMYMSNFFSSNLRLRFTSSQISVSSLSTYLQNARRRTSCQL